MVENLNLLLVFGAGVASVFSPCILPILPLVVAGQEREDRARPLLLVAGLSATFVLMGIVTSLFGAAVAPAMTAVEKIAAVVILLFGILMLLDWNVFKALGFLQAWAGSRGDKYGGFVLGLTLGVVWIPCVGPILSAVLALVAAKATLAQGAGLLLVYSLGFSIPILAAAYAAHFFRSQVGFFQSHPALVRVGSALLLIGLGSIMLLKGMAAFGSIF